MHAYASVVRRPLCHSARVAQDMKGAFRPYVDQTVNILAPLIKEALFDDIRLAAVACMPDLLRAARCGVSAANKSQMAHVRDMFNFCTQHLMEAMEKEQQIELLMLMVQSVQHCLDALTDHDSRTGAATSLIKLNEAQMDSMMKQMARLLQQSFQRRAVEVAQSKTENFDEEA